MSFTNTTIGRKTASGSNIQKDVIYQNSLDNYAEYAWVRPIDWLSMPTVTAAEQKFVGLFAVYNDESNFCSLIFSGNYTVDWGDGTPTENYTGGVTAGHIYNYNDISSSTITSKGYRQVLVTVTPQAGQNLTSIKLNVLHPTLTALGTGFYYTSVPWLDIVLSMPNLTNYTSFELGSRTEAPGASCYHPLLERVRIINHGLTNFTNAFTGLPRIEVIEFDCSRVTSLSSTFFRNGLIFGPNIDTSNVTTTFTFNNFPNPFPMGRLIYTPKYNLPRCSQILYQYTYFLDSIGGFETSGNLTNLASAFSDSGIREISFFNTSNVNNMSGIFTNCTRLKSVPAFDTRNVNNFSSMFSSCTALKNVPLLNTSRAQNLSGMFNGCSALKKIPFLNTSNVSNMSTMFQNCIGLKEVPAFNTSRVTNMNSIFNGCTSLVRLPSFDTANVTDFAASFQSCTSLQQIPQYNYSRNTSLNLTFKNNVSLLYIPPIDASNCNVFINTFQTCTALAEPPTFTAVRPTAVTGDSWLTFGATNFNYIPKNYLWWIPNTAPQERFTNTRIHVIKNLNYFNATSFAFSYFLRQIEHKNFASSAVQGSSTNNFDFCRSLANVIFSNVRITSSTGVNAMNFTQTKLSQKNLEVMFDSFAGNNSSTNAVTLTITNLIGARPEITQLGNLITGRYVIDMANTQLLSVGMEIRGNGITSPVAVTLQTAANTVTLASHGLPANTLISFANTNVAGIDLNTPYRISNVLTNTFQLQNPTSNANITFNADGVGNIFYGATITGINASSNVSITVPLRVTGNNVPTLSGNLKRSIARLKGFTIVG